MRRIMLGIGTSLPAVYFFGFLCFVLFLFVSPWHPPGDVIVVLGVAHFATILLVIGLLIFYVRHVFRNPQLTSEQKSLWIIVLLFGNPIAMPIYWYHYVLSGEKRCQEGSGEGKVSGTDY